MAKVRVLFYGGLRDITNEKECEVELSSKGETVHSVIDKLCDKYGVGFCRKIWDVDTLSLHWRTRLWLNGEALTDKELNMSVGDGDELKLFFLIAAMGG